MAMLWHIALVLVPFIIVTVLGRPTIRFCQTQGLVAKITTRHAHKTPTPHGGGIVVIGTVVPLALATIWFYPLPHQTFLTIMLFMSLILAGMGWLDDIRHRSPLLRLIVHLCCVGVTALFLPPLFDLVPLWVEKIILILAWTWFLNLYNFMDGLDGLTSTEALFICLALLILVPSLGPLAAIISGAVLAFLRLNWHPAKIFIGDSGSTWLGFILGGLLLLALEWDTWRLVYPLFTVTLVFSADATYTLFKCIAEGHKPWLPHRKFWFHRAAKMASRHDTVVGRIALLNVLLLGLALGGYWLDAGPTTLILGLLLMAVSARWIQRQERKN